jgi:flavin-dependent dehydrogenase
MHCAAARTEAWTPRHSYDFVIIGGGPAGATAATLLADAQYAVLVLEGTKFPRFAVGEIIAPTGLWRVWHRLGLAQETLDELFIRKWAGAWQAPDGTLFTFDQDVHPDDPRCRPFVYTLERATYDLLLLENARAHGAEALEEAWVEEVIRNDAGRVVGVRFKHAGRVHEVRCPLVIDASGRSNVLAKQLGLRLEVVELKSFSVFAHYQRAHRAEGRAEGDVRLIFSENMWFWWAPLKAPKASIGIVAHRDKYWHEYIEVGAEQFYEKYVRQCPFIWERLRHARRITGFRPVHRGSGSSTLEGYHYQTTDLVGDGWVLVGDAGGFVDPIFSAGLFVAQTSAMWLADEIIAAMEEGNLSQERLARYQARYDRELGRVMRHIQTYATYYFDPKFVNFYLGLGNRSPRIRRLYIGTFVAYDTTAIDEYTRLIDRHFRSFRPWAEADESGENALPTGRRGGV